MSKPAPWLSVLIFGLASSAAIPQESNAQAISPVTTYKTEKAPHPRSSSGPYEAMIGHWREVAAAADTANPNYRGKASSTATELFIGGSTTWVVAPGKQPRKVNYTVSDVDLASFTLRQTIVLPNGETINSRVEFSPDRTEMRNIRTFNLPIGSSKLTTTYRRVDGRTSPP